MATYNICDLCGKDLKDGPTYFIAVGPSISVRKTDNKDIDDVRNSSFFERIEPHSNKEVCKECANAYALSLDKAESLRDDHSKCIAVGHYDDESLFQGELYTLGNYLNV